MHPLQGIVCYLAKLFSGLPRLLESPLRVTPHSSQPQAALRKPQKASEVSKVAQSERKQAPGREALGISTLQQVAGPASGRKGGGGRSPLQIGGRAPPSTTATSSKAGPAAPSGRRPRPRARRAAPRAGWARTPRFLPQALRPGPPPRPRPRRPAPPLAARVPRERRGPPTRARRIPGRRGHAGDTRRAGGALRPGWPLSCDGPGRVGPDSRGSRAARQQPPAASRRPAARGDPAVLPRALPSRASFSGAHLPTRRPQPALQLQLGFRGLGSQRLPHSCAPQRNRTAGPALAASGPTDGRCRSAARFPLDRAAGGGSRRRALSGQPPAGSPPLAGLQRTACQRCLLSLCPPSTQSRCPK